MTPFKASFAIAIVVLGASLVVGEASPNNGAAPTKYLFTIPRELASGSNETFCFDVQNVPSAGLEVSVILKKSESRVSSWRGHRNPWIQEAPPTTPATTATSPIFSVTKLVILNNNDRKRRRRTATEGEFDDDDDDWDGWWVPDNDDDDDYGWGEPDPGSEDSDEWGGVEEVEEVPPLPPYFGPTDPPPLPQTRFCGVLAIPADIPGGEAEIRIQGKAKDDSNYTFDETRTIHLKKGLTRVTFVETDKPVYKPGDLVRVRLLTVDAALKPVDDDVEVLWIESPAGVRMEQWNNVSRRAGFAEAEMKLSSEPVEGLWKVKAKVAGKRVTRSFEVKEYVAPKFEVTMKTNKFLLLNDDDLKSTVCAQYTYGKRVEGTVKLEITRRRYGREDMEPVMAEGTLKDGCFFHKHDIDLTQLRSEWGIKYHVSAEVTEMGTNIKRSVEKTIKIVRKPVKVEIEELKNGYKPFITDQAIHVKVTTAVDEPAPEEIVRVKISKTWDSRLPGENDLTLLEVNVTADANGIAKVPLTINLTKWDSLDVQAESLTYSNGRRQISDNSLKSDVSFGQSTHRRMFCLPFFHSLSVRSWFSPSKSFLKIFGDRDPVACGATLRLPVVYTTNISDPESIPRSLQFTAIARGKVVARGDGEADGLIDSTSEEGVQSLIGRISVPVDESFAPAFKLLVYYVRPDGEVVADEQSFATAECLVNDVGVEFRPPRRLPGEKTLVSIKAAPESLCGFSIVDKSVSLMGSQNTLKKADIFEWLKKGEIGEKYFGDENREYCKKAASQGEEEESRMTTTPWPMPPRPRPFFGGGGGRRPRSIWRPWDSWRSDRHDSITAFRNAGVLTITDMVLESRPCKRERHTYYRTMMQVDAVFDDGPPVMAMMPRGGPLRRKGLAGPVATTTTGMPLTTTTTNGLSNSNSNNNNNNNNNRKKKQKMQEAEIRSFFPETWLWNMHKIDESGVFTFEKKVPHTITEWQGRAVCSNSAVGLGVSPTQPLVVFQPFFASARLPYSVIRGEKVPLKIQIFNYLEKADESDSSECMAVQLKLIKYRSLLRVIGSSKQTVCLCAQQSSTLEFVVVPGVVGDINVTVSAEALKDGAGICQPEVTMSEEAKGVKDVVIKKLTVEPEGIEVESNWGRFVCLDPNGASNQLVDLHFEEQIRLDFDATNYVRKSGLLRVSAIGDVLGPALEGLDDLIRLPTGCGEQNMLKFAPNIFVLQYLEATKQDGKEIKEKAIEFMKTGYQRELTYRHDDGSFSAFGKSDDSGSLWLTAFVVKCFGRARQFINIDQSDLDLSIRWLKRKQRQSGEFPTIGRVVHKDMKGGLADKKFDIGLTAYTIGALLDAGVSASDSHVQSGLRFILPANNSVLESLDSYSLWLVADTLSTIDVAHPRLAGILDVLDGRRRGESGMRFWSDSGVVDGGASAAAAAAAAASSSKVSSADIETTAYALMTHVKLRKIDEAVEMTRWLTTQRNAKGGFLSTQDTVCGLQALAGISEVLYAKTGEFHVEFKTENQTTEFDLKRVSRLLLHRAEMEFDGSPASSVINVHVTPKSPGCAMIQANLKYNVIKPPKDQKEFGKKSFSLRQRVAILRDRPDHCKWRELETCLTFRGGKGPSGMVMVEVKMVSGWIPDKDSLKKITKRNAIIKRFDVDSRMIKFYLDKLVPDSQFCFNYLVEQETSVVNAKPGLIKVYDYYEPEVVVDQKYKIRQTCGTKMELPFVNEPVDPNGPPMQRRSDSAGGGCPSTLDDLILPYPYCNASVVVTAVVERNNFLTLLHLHKGDAATNVTIPYFIGGSCGAKSDPTLLLPGNHVWLAFLQDYELTASSIIFFDKNILATSMPGQYDPRDSPLGLTVESCRNSG